MLHYFSSRQKREGRSMDRPWYASPGIGGDTCLKGRKILITYTLLLPLDLVFHFWTMAVCSLSVFLRSNLVWQSHISLCGKTSNRWFRLLPGSSTWSPLRSMAEQAMIFSANTDLHRERVAYYFAIERSRSKSLPTNASRVIILYVLNLCRHNLWTIPQAK
jgi:hypothetical protein